MLCHIPEIQHLPRRSLPKGFQTAYPRRQLDCPDPSQGLASIEALYIAFFLLGRECDFLLDGYYWKELFLQRNTFQQITKTDTI
jgi:pre-rRNA-processing protein TSR3